VTVLSLLLNLTYKRVPPESPVGGCRLSGNDGSICRTLLQGRERNHVACSNRKVASPESPKILDEPVGETAGKPLWKPAYQPLRDIDEGLWNERVSARNEQQCENDSTSGFPVEFKCRYRENGNKCGGWGNAIVDWCILRCLV
jgi:hypothetical protein